MSETIRGSETAVGPRLRITGSQQGRTVEYLYEGTIESMRYLATTLVEGTDFVLDETNPPVASLVIRQQGITDSELLGTQFEIRANTQQKSILEHPKSVRLGVDAVGAVRNELKKSVPSGSGFNGWALTLYNKLRLGQDYFLVSQPVFRTSQTLKNNREHSFAMGNHNCIYSNAQLIVEANPFAPFRSAIVNLAAGMESGLFESSIPSGFVLGWLKQNYEMVNVPGGRYVATLEYVLDAWPTDTYQLSNVAV